MLRDLTVPARIGLTCLVLVILGGLVASAAHMAEHLGKRDEQPGLSLDDIVGHYHGVNIRAPLITALERNHPKDLPAEDATLLMTWLTGNRIGQDYDNLDLGDAAPAEIIDRDCLSCHARNATKDDGSPHIGATIPLEYWDDIEKLAYSRQINPVPTGVMLASAHTHALSLAMLVILVGGLAVMTRWPRPLSHSLVMVAGVGLLVDLGSWWLARYSVGFVYAIIVGGGVFAAATGLMLVLVLIDLWTPKMRDAGE